MGKGVYHSLFPEFIMVKFHFCRAPKITGVSNIIRQYEGKSRK